ncbi:MAG: HAD family hydrolase [Firmicutes bacterium]|nr:HAD family hydrolase [Bacillota bacterium]
MIKLFVFDLDGTLLNSLEDLANSTNYALEKNGYPARTIEEYRRFVSDGLPKLIERALGEKYNPEIGLRLTEDFVAYYSSHYVDATRLYSGVAEMLNELRASGILLAILSNKPDPFLRIMIEQMFPAGTFAMVQGKTDQFLTKPDPASLQYVLHELHISPSETLYIGDSDVDIYTAHNAGVKAVGVTWGFRDQQELEDAGADYIVVSPSEILTLASVE